MAEQTRTIRVRLPTSEDVAKARDYLEENVGDCPTQNWDENYARETVKMAGLPQQVEIKLQALRVGEFAIATTPCETFGSTGLAIKQASPFGSTMIIELANGYNGYLPPPDQFELGGYSTWRARTCYLEKGAEPQNSPSADPSAVPGDQFQDEASLVRSHRHVAHHVATVEPQPLLRRSSRM